MRTAMSFEINSEYRVMDNSELIYTLTNSEHLTRQAKRAEAMEADLSLSAVLEQLTPARKMVALAAIELYRRSKCIETEKITSSRDIYSLMRSCLEDLPTEEFWAIFINQSAKVVGKVRVSSGGLTGVSVDIRVVMKQALMCNATSFFVCHNHPSGNSRASKEDNELTDRIRKAGELMNVRLLDHVIIGRDSYYSYTDEGLLF